LIPARRRDLGTAILFGPKPSGPVFADVDPQYAATHRDRIGDKATAGAWDGILRGVVGDLEDFIVDEVRLKILGLLIGNSELGVHPQPAKERGRTDADVGADDAQRFAGSGDPFAKTGADLGRIAGGASGPAGRRR